MSNSIFEGTIADMTWVELDKSIKEGAVVLLPTGVIEEHGPHLSLGTDTYTSWLLTHSTRQSLEAQGIQTLIAPPCYWGVNRATNAFPGSFTVRPETFKALLLDIYSCLNTWGVKHVFCIDAHGDPVHEQVIFAAAQEARETLGLNVVALVEDYKVEMLGLTGKEPHILVAATPPIDGPMPEYVEIHAGAIETGLMLEHFPDTVRVEIAKAQEATRLTYADIPAWQHGGEQARALTPLGYFGAPADFERDLDEVRKYYQALPTLYAEAIAQALNNQAGH